MARAPRFSVRVQPLGAHEATEIDRDLARRLISMKFVDSEKKADLFTIEFSNRDLRFPDDPLFEHGTTLYVRWGAFALGPERVCVVQKWTPGWDKFTVEAHGQGVILNKEPLTKVWYNASRSDVARDIATKAGYPPYQQFIDDTVDVFETVQARGKTAAQLCAAMAAKESSNYGTHFIFNANSSGFYFHARRLEQPSRRIYEWVGPNAGSMRAFPSFKASVQAKPGAVTVKGVDKDTGKPIEARADNETTAGRPGLAGVRINMDKKTGAKAYMQDVASEVVCTTAAPNAAEAKKTAQAQLSKRSGMPIEGSFPVDGDPFLEPKMVITVQKIGQMLSGNYYIKEVTHTVTPGDYVCELTILRDGVNRTGLTGSAAQAKQSSATQNDTTPTGGSGTPGAPPDLQPVIGVSNRTGDASYSYQPVGGMSGGPAGNTSGGNNGTTT